jgi:hypothetical protein
LRAPERERTSWIQLGHVAPLVLRAMSLAPGLPLRLVVGNGVRHLLSENRSSIDSQNNTEKRKK